MPIKTYTVADGLLSDEVHKIKQDSRGFLWFCTSEGVSRFDGYAFANFTTDDGLPDRRVRDFLETKHGEIFVATDGGLARLDPTGISGSKENQLFKTYRFNNWRAETVNVLFEDESGSVFVGTRDGVYKLNAREDELEAVDLGKSSDSIGEIKVAAIIKDRRGAMWIGTLGSGLFRLLPDGQVEQFTIENGLPGNFVAFLSEDENGRIWAGTRAFSLVDGLCLLVESPQKSRNIVERVFTTKDGLPVSWIPALYQSSDGRFWAATVRGLCLWQGENNGSVCKTYTAKNDLCDHDVWTIVEDKDKNLWTGSRCGAKKWTRYGFTTYSAAEGMDNPRANSIFENAAGELFVSFYNDESRTVSRFDGEKFELVKPNFPPGIHYFGWGWKQTVRQDSAGDWWFPSGDGIYRFKQPAKFEDLSKLVPQKITVGTKPAEVFRFFEDSHGDLWIATVGQAQGLWYWERESDVWHDYTNELGVGRNRTVSAFVEDKAGNLWIGTGNNENDTALIRYRLGQFKIFTQQENPLLAGWMRDLFVDDKGRLWIADSATGVLRLDDVNADRLAFKRYAPADGLSSIAVSCITEDEFGRIYIGTERGLDRLNPETGQVENFTTADGLPNSNVQIAYRDRQNNLWFGTTNGLARFKPEPEHKREPPNVLITGLRVSGVANPISILGEKEIAALELNSDQRQVTVEFLGLGASLGEHLKYEYRFGESADWTRTEERTVNFANLSSGDYRFEVRAETADRIYSQPATVSFKIAAPLWRRPWFVGMILLVTISTAYLFYKNRLARLLQMERMRTRIATDLHDDIGANLTRISLLSEVAKQKSDNGSGNLLTSIADIARESVASMNDIVWAISPDHDRLLDLTRRMRRHAEEIFALRDVDLDFRAPSADADLKLSVGVRRDVLLIFKEAVNNAAKHSDCSRIEIDFRVDNTNLFLRIKDDGKGFEIDAESDGQGLRSIARRARALGGNLQ
ncbi:MAG: ligand-binding sensor domain-containing protein, partial [Pyrinomonadaceae bacterium]